MGERTAAAAVNTWLERLHRLLSCVTQAQFNVRGGYYVSDVPHGLYLAPSPAPLGRDRSISLRAVQRYLIVPAPSEPAWWDVETVSYLYALDDAGTGREILSWQWDPLGRAATGSRTVTWPHLHVSAGSGRSGRRLQGAHIPTGPIGLSDVFRFAIEELSVQPVRGDWEEILQSHGV